MFPEINSTDNLVWVPVEVHRRINADYSRTVQGMTGTYRDTLNGLSWDEQHRRGIRAVNRAMRREGQG